MLRLDTGLDGHAAHVSPVAPARRVESSAAVRLRACVYSPLWGLDLSWRKQVAIGGTGSAEREAKNGEAGTVRILELLTLYSQCLVMAERVGFIALCKRELPAG